MSQTGWEKLRQGLGLQPNILVMLAAVVLVGMGEEMWARFVPKYLEALGASAWGIATYGTLRELLDALYQYPGGWVSDHWGRLRALVLFTCLALMGYLIYLLSPSWEWVLAGTALVMAWSSLTAPVVFAIIGDSLPPAQRGMGFGIQSLVRRLPIIAAPPLGGLLVAWLGMVEGVKTAIGITIVLALISVSVALRFYRERPRIRHEAIGFVDLWQGMHPGLKRLLVADCLARWAEGIPKVFIVLYVLNVLLRSPLEFGWLTSLQMLTAILLYIPVAKISDSLNRKPFILLTFVFFACFPLVLAFADSLPLLILAFVFAGLREIGEPARKALIVDLAPEAARGRAVGLYYLVRQLIVFPAALLGAWLWMQEPRLALYAAFAFGSLGAAFYALWGPDDAPALVVPSS